MKVHPLVQLADTMPLGGDSHEILCAKANEACAGAERLNCKHDLIRAISAMTLAEYILEKRQAYSKQSYASLFPIPKSSRKPITVRAKSKIK